MQRKKSTSKSRSINQKTRQGRHCRFINRRVIDHRAKVEAKHEDQARTTEVIHQQKTEEIESLTKASIVEPAKRGTEECKKSKTKRRIIVSL